MTDRGNIYDALNKMQKEAGVFWRGGDWICCGSCGHAELEDVNSYVFWHEQSEERAFGVECSEEVEYEEYDEENDEWYTEIEYEWDIDFVDDLQHSLYIYHSGVEAASEAVKYLLGAGMNVHWNGSAMAAIEVTP